MKLRPLNNRVIIRRLIAGSTSSIISVSKEKSDFGEVVAVGPGLQDERGEYTAMGVKVGDKVLYSKYTGQTIFAEGEEFLVVREDDIMAVEE